MQSCASCSFTFTAQRKFELAQYEREYAESPAFLEMLEAARRTASGEFGRRELWWYKRLVLRWMEGMEVSHSLLDVGSGPGTFLMVARQLGWESRGIEPSTTAATLAVELGTRTFRGCVEDFVAQDDEKFGVITSFEVLEHVGDPVVMLRAMRALLETNGRLVLSVPNLDDPYCLQHRIRSAMPPVHVNFFNRRSLRAALRTAGFAALRFTSLPIPTSSVRNVHGKTGFLVRLPLLALQRLLGRTDGTTLLCVARADSECSV